MTLIYIMLYSIWVHYKDSSDPLDNKWITGQYDFLLYLTEDRQKADEIYATIIATPGNYIMDSYQKVDILSIEAQIPYSDFWKWYLVQHKAGLTTYGTLERCKTNEDGLPILDKIINIKSIENAPLQVVPCTQPNTLKYVITNMAIALVFAAVVYITNRYAA